MNEQKKEVAAQWWAECDKRIYDFPEKPARSIFEQGFVAGQAAHQPEPSTEVKRSRLYEIAEYLRGLGNDADASHVENCALDMVSMKHEIQTAMRGNKVSIDISTCDDDAGAREFATIIGKQPDIDGSVIWLCELDHYNDDAKPIDSEGYSTILKENASVQKSIKDYLDDLKRIESERETSYFRIFAKSPTGHYFVNVKCADNDAAILTAVQQTLIDEHGPQMGTITILNKEKR